MKLEIYDGVVLNCEIDTLAKKGIHKGCSGNVIEIYKEHCLVMFMSPWNYGDYAYARVNLAALDFLCKNDEIIDAMENIAQKFDKAKDSFILCDVKEYDKVELIVEKPKYAIEGAHKGMTGCVMSSYAINNQWLIIFSEDGTGKDIADICVDREDFRVIE